MRQIGIESILGEYFAYSGGIPKVFWGNTFHFFTYNFVFEKQLFMYSP